MRYACRAVFSASVYGVMCRFIITLTGHVGAVYMVSWSPDSRFLASCSKDSTVKVWQSGSASKGKALHTLPGHADEVGVGSGNWLGHCGTSALVAEL